LAEQADKSLGCKKVLFHILASPLLASPGLLFLFRFYLILSLAFLRFSGHLSIFWSLFYGKHVSNSENVISGYIFWEVLIAGLDAGFLKDVKPTATYHIDGLQSRTSTGGL